MFRHGSRRGRPAARGHGRVTIMLACPAEAAAVMGELTNWMAGELTPQARVLTALLPALVVSAYFVVGYVLYILRSLIWGQPRQFEQDARGRTAFLGTHLRLYFFWLVNPLWRLLLASGISANTVTALAGAMGLGAALAAAGGRFALAGWLFIFSGILD